MFEGCMYQFEAVYCSDDTFENTEVFVQTLIPLKATAETFLY
jgi:hypothetical protein